MTRQKWLQFYLYFLGTFTLFWWPLSHWLYPNWYHRLLGFSSYDDSLVKIIGTVGIIPVLGMFFAAVNPVRNRDIIKILVIFSVLMAATYIYLINFQGFPEREYVNVILLVYNTAMLKFLFPPKNFPIGMLTASDALWDQELIGSPS